MRVGEGGVTLIEVIVAVLLLSVIALGLTTTLTQSQHGLRGGGQLLRAIALASAAMEQMRAGQMPAALAPEDGFTRTAKMSPWDGHPGLYRIDVSVEWTSDAAHSYTLSSLVQR